MLAIRQATTADAPTIALLGRVTFSETFGHLFEDKNDLLEYHQRTFSVEKINSSLQKEQNLFWLAFYQKLPVGYAKLKLNSTSAFITKPQVCQLQKIYVLQDFLSKKIGLHLQSTLIDEASKRNFETIWLSVLKSNTRAIRFYEKNNFIPIGNHQFQIGKENFSFLAMAREL